jgi:hypothetical protein
MNAFAIWVRSLWPFGQHMIIPERRARTRILTFKNVVRAAIGLIVAFILLSFWSAWRPAHSGTSLLEPHAASSEPSAVAGEPLPVVSEGSVRDYPDAQLIVHDAPPPPAPPVARETTLEPAKSPLRKGQKIVISGGSEGVHVYVAPPPPQRARNRNRAPGIAQ